MLASFAVACAGVTLDLALLFPITSGGRDLGTDYKQIACGAELAANHINAGDERVVQGLSSLTQGVQVRTRLYDSEESETTSIRAYRQARDADAHALVGASYSSISETLARLGSVDQIPQCSYWASSVSLSDKDAFPLFARTYPSDRAATKALPIVLRHFGWSTIGVIHANDDYANRYLEGLRQWASRYDINVAISSSFQTGDRSARDTIGRAVDTIADTRVNIIVAITFDVDAVELLNRAEARGIYGKGYAWLTTDSISANGAIAAADGDPAEARRLLDGLLNFYTSPRGSSGFELFGSAWASAPPSQCANNLFDAPSIEGLFGGSPFSVAAYAYDCVVALSAATARTHGGPTNASGLHTELLGTRFEGASGDVYFDAVGDRAQASSTYALENWKVDGQQIVTSTAAHVMGEQFNISASTPIHWRGGGAAPVDRFSDDISNYLPSELVWPALVLTALCVAIALGFALWTVYNRKSRIVKVAQPGFLCAIILGSLLSICAIFPAAIDHRGGTDSSTSASALDETARFPALDVGCNLQASLYSVGFAITFGSLLTKLHRITRIVTNVEIGGTKRMLSSRSLTLMALGLVGVQLLMMLLMSTTAPLYYHLTVERIHGLPVNAYGACDKHDGEPTLIYMCLTLSAQMALLLYANILCYRAREIPTQYAETKYVAFACANHLQTKAFAILAAAFTYHEPQVTFLVKWLALTVSDFGTLCLIFIPKIWMQRTEGSAAMIGIQEQLREVAVNAWSKKAEKEERSEKLAAAASLASKLRRTPGRNTRYSRNSADTPNVSKESGRSTHRSRHSDNPSALATAVRASSANSADSPMVAAAQSSIATKMEPITSGRQSGRVELTAVQVQLEPAAALVPFDNSPATQPVECTPDDHPPPCTMNRDGQADQTDVDDDSSAISDSNLDERSIGPSTPSRSSSSIVIAMNDDERPTEVRVPKECEPAAPLA